MNIFYLDRLSGQIKQEKVYKENAIRLLYSDSWWSRFLIKYSLLPLLTKWPFFSYFYGILQKRPSSKKKILPFIEEFQVDAHEFLEPISQFHSFNDFFIRKLKPEARPIVTDPLRVIIPADGRYYFYQNIEEADGFTIKGQKFNLSTLLDNSTLAHEYADGSMVIARLCPYDYHRFHFPCDCLPGETHFINGWLYSVNPLAIKRDLEIFTKNKRTLCSLETPQFGRVLYLEIGATNVGSIKQTYKSLTWQPKGAEKGYFEFGASSLILLFQKGKITFDSDLSTATEQGVEIRCLFGQSMGIGLAG